MREFEVIYVEIIEAEDFFDAVEQLEKDGRQILSCAEVPQEDEDVLD